MHQRSIRLPYLALASLFSCLALTTSCSEKTRATPPVPEETCLNFECGDNAFCVYQHGPKCTCEEGFVQCAQQCIPQTQACNEVEEGNCTPGEVDCLDTATQRVCNSDGQWESEPCPQSQPYCENGTCSPQECLGGQRKCEGFEVYECNSDSTGWTLIESCMGECFEGICLDPCGLDQDKLSYLGCTFWAVPLQNHAQSAQEDFAITISSHGNLPIDIGVTTAAGDEVETATIQPRALLTLPLQSLSQISGTGITQQSYRINTTGKVTVHQFNPVNEIDIHSSDASLLLPLGALGRAYRAIAWPTELYYIGMTTPCALSTDCPFTTQWCNEELEQCEGPVAIGSSQITIVATSFETTSVQLSSPIRVEIRNASGASVVYPENQSFALDIQRGDVLTLSSIIESGADLTGLEITANHEVAVFSSNTCAMIPHGSFACDHLEQQLFPTATWGTEYVGAKFKPRGEEPDVWKILADTDGTALSTIPAIPALEGITLQAGDAIEFEWNKDFVLQASHPVSMAQFMVSADYPGPNGGCGGNGLTPGPAINRENCAIAASSLCGSQAIGDPAFLTNVPSSQFRTSYTVLVPGDYAENYLTFIAPIGEIISTDGNATNLLPTPIDGTGWGTLTMPVTSGVHNISSSAAFGLIGYGYDCTVSYAYPGGLNLEISE